MWTRGEFSWNVLWNISEFENCSWRCEAPVQPWLEGLYRRPAAELAGNYPFGPELHISSQLTDQKLLVNAPVHSCEFVWSCGNDPKSPTLTSPTHPPQLIAASRRWWSRCGGQWLRTRGRRSRRRQGTTRCWPFRPAACPASTVGDCLTTYVLPTQQSHQLMLRQGTTWRCHLRI